MHEDADLPSGLHRSVDERARQLRRRDVVERNASPVKALERLRRVRREAGRISVELDVGSLTTVFPRTRVRIRDAGVCSANATLLLVVRGARPPVCGAL